MDDDHEDDKENLDLVGKTKHRPVVVVVAACVADERFGLHRLDTTVLLDQPFALQISCW